MMPPKTQRLAREAREAASWRGHVLGRFIPDTPHARGNPWRGTATCTNEGCSAYVTIDTHPPANGIDIDGSAVAVNCPEEG